MSLFDIDYSDMKPGETYVEFSERVERQNRIDRNERILNSRCPKCNDPDYIIVDKKRVCLKCDFEKEAIY